MISEPSYFPKEIWRKIIQFIPLQERFRLEAICKRWKELMPYSDVTELIVNKPYSRNKFGCFFDDSLKLTLPRCGQYLTGISVSKGIPLLLSVSAMRMVKECCPRLEKLMLQSCKIVDIDVLNHVPQTVKHLGLPGIPEERVSSGDSSRFNRVCTRLGLQDTPVENNDNNDTCLLYRQGLSDLLQAKPDLLSLHLRGFLTGTAINLPSLLSLSIDTYYPIRPPGTCGFPYRFSLGQRRDREFNERLGIFLRLMSIDVDRICQNCPCLHNLALSSGGYYSEKLELRASISQLAQLHSLSLEIVSVSIEALQALYNSCTDLNSITFKRCELANASQLPPLLMLESLPKLAVLKFFDCGVDDAVLKQMIRSGNLREVIITNKISLPMMLAILQANPNLETMEAVRDEVVNLTAILQASLSLTSLCLQFTIIKQMATICDSNFIRPLQKLTLKRASLNDSSIRALSKVCPELSELVLEECTLVPTEADLPEFPMLKHVEIIENFNISSLVRICQGAKLQSLSLQGNWPPGALTTITGNCPELKNLSLSLWCSSRDIAIEDLSSALQNVPGLKELKWKGKWPTHVIPGTESMSKSETEFESDLGLAIANHARSLTSLLLHDCLNPDTVVISLALHRSRLIGSGIELPSLEVKSNKYFVNKKNYFPTEKIILATFGYGFWAHHEAL